MNLPEGFVLDQPAGLPDGFVLDQPSLGEDVAKSAGIGVVKGGLGLAGISGDIRELAAKGINRASGALGYELPQDKVAAALKLASPGGVLAGPTSQQLQGGLETVTGPLYKPQTTAGEYAQTAGEFLPNAAMGPGGLVRRGIGQVLAPAIASETAGQLTAGTAAEPYARIAGGVAGGVAGARATAPRAAEAAIPAAEQIRDAARAGYQHPEVAAVQIRPASVEAAADRIAADLNRRGQLNNVAPNTHRALDELRNTGNTPGLPPGVATVQEIRSVRQNLGELAKEVSPIGRPTSEAVAAGVAARRLDAYLDGLRQPDLVAGNAQRASQILREANRDWAAASKAEDIGTRLTRAERQAAKSGSGSNIDNALRQKISAVLDVPSRTVGLRPNEIAQAERVVRGTPTGNVLRKVGKLGFGDGLSLLLHAGVTLPSGGANIPIGIAGTLARKAGERITQREANRLEEMIRARSAEAERWRAIQARINGVLPPSLGTPAVGLLGGLGGSNQMRGGLLPFDQRWSGLEQLQ